MKRARTGKIRKGKRVKTTTVGFYAGPPRRRTKTERVSQELKFLDTDVVDAQINNTMTFFNPMIIPQGDTESERIGRKVIIKSLSIKGTLTLTGAIATANTSSLVTMKVVQDTQTNKNLFGATDLLETDTFDSFNQLANRNRFRVLKSCTYRFKAG